MPSVTSAPTSRAAGRIATRARAPGGFFYRTVSVDIDGAPGPEAAIFDGPNSVYLSPHHDDACFSLGALIKRRPGGRLINLFTRSGFSVSPPSGSPPDVEAITRRRTEEDDAFAAHCHLNKVDLGLSDAPLLGRGAWDLAGVEADCAALTPPLLSRLMAIAAETPPDEKLTLFCPAGIGGHVNHVATMVAVVRALPMLRPRYRVVFYEDLHYAAVALARPTGLRLLAKGLGTTRATRLAIGFDAHVEAKLALVRLYRSQFETLPETCERYSPDAGAPVLGFHEAIWDFQTQTASVALKATQLRLPGEYRETRRGNPA